MKEVRGGMRRVRDVAKELSDARMSIWRKTRHLPEMRGGGRFQHKRKRQKKNDKRERTKGVSFGPQMRASQVKKSDSEIGPRLRK